VPHSTVTPGTGLLFTSVTVADSVLAVPSAGTDEGLATRLATFADAASATNPTVTVAVFVVAVAVTVPDPTLVERRLTEA